MIDALAALVLSAIEPVGHISAPPGFIVEHVHAADSEEGSWVCMDFDDSGRLVIAPERGRLLRLTLTDDGVEVEQLDTPVQRAQGLLHHGDSLYCNVNAPLAEGGGFHRLRDRDRDGIFEQHEQLAAWDWGGEHGAHAIVLSPSGDSLYLVHGNHVRPPEGILDTSPLRNWDEDILLERLWDPRGHAVGRMAPAGHVMETDLDGSSFRLIAGGLRNAYDIAFNEDGELFTYDADMEWDIGTGWYRFPRIVHVVSGGETGWRGGSAKWSDAWPDVNPHQWSRLTWVHQQASASPMTPPSRNPGDPPCSSATGPGAACMQSTSSRMVQGWKGSIEPFIKGRPFNITDLDVGPGRAPLLHHGWSWNLQRSLPCQVDGGSNPRKATPLYQSPIGPDCIRRMLESWHGDADPRSP